MKRIFLISVLILSFELSKELDSTKNKIKGMVKCFLDTKAGRDSLVSLIEKIFTFKNLEEVFIPIYQLNPMIKECTGIDIISFIASKIGGLKNEPKKAEVLKKIKNFDAPILLRKYLHDFIFENGLENAKNECLSLIREKPYVQYKTICSLL